MNIPKFDLRAYSCSDSFGDREHLSNTVPSDDPLKHGMALANRKRIVILTRVSSRGQRQNHRVQLECICAEILTIMGLPSSGLAPVLVNKLQQQDAIEVNNWTIMWVLETGNGNLALTKRKALLNVESRLLDGGILVINDRSRLARNANVAYEFESRLGKDSRIVSLLQHENEEPLKTIADLKAERVHHEKNMNGSRNRPRTVCFKDQRSGRVRTREITPISEEVRTLMHRLRDSSHSLAQTAIILNQEGHRSAMGKLFTSEIIRRETIKKPVEFHQKEITRIDMAIASLLGFPRRGPSVFGFLRSSNPTGVTFDNRFTRVVHTILTSFDLGHSKRSIARNLQSIWSSENWAAPPRGSAWSDTSVSSLVDLLRVGPGEPSELGRHLMQMINPITPEQEVLRSLILCHPTR